MVFDRKSGATAWLGIAVVSVAFMGVYAFFVALARTPVIGAMFGDPDFFRTALVTHVVLAVVIWFLAFILFTMHYITASVPTGKGEFRAVDGAAIGVALIVATPFTGPAHPILNNYVPVLDRWLYLLGVAIFFIAVAVAFLLRARATLDSGANGNGPALITRGSLLTAGLALISAILCFVISWYGLSTGPVMEESQRRFYFEVLFWGGGHTLQFANGLGLMAVWSILASKLTSENILDDKVTKGLLAVIALFIISAPLQYFIYDHDSVELRSLFTSLKGWGLSFGPIILGAAIFVKRKNLSENPVASRGLFLSMFLFALGGAIALTLSGSDTRVPAHYHGVIGGVTLCFMTLAQLAVTENGWLTVSEKWKKIQITLYGMGQSLFVIGLYIGGTRGAQRKTFGTSQQLDDAMKYFGMSVMGIGGLMAVTSGVFFVIFMLKSFNAGRKKAL